MSSPSGLWPIAMENPVRRYDWGSITALARIQGREPDGTTEAELWVGAHPDSPSKLCLEAFRADGDYCGQELVGLDQIISQDPQRYLGSHVSQRFGAQLPFLTKVLAISRALSIQVHPTAEQARAGYEYEHSAGVPVHQRTFTDSHPKPEMLYALERTLLMAGARPEEAAAGLLELLAKATAAPAYLHRVAEVAQRSIADVFGFLAGWSDHDRKALSYAAAQAAHSYSSSSLIDGFQVEATDLSGTGCRVEDWRQMMEWIERLAGQHPGDPLVIAPMLLQLITLEPGDTLFLPAGVPHAYLSGLGVEIMAPSDNVVRAGLTTKPVRPRDVNALIDDQAHPLWGVPCRMVSETEMWWEPPTHYFRMSRIVSRDGVDTTAVAVPGPQTLLCVRGSAQVTADRTVEVASGQSVYIGDTQTPIHISGDAVLFRTFTAL